MQKKLPVISLKYSHQVPAHKRPTIKSNQQAYRYLLKHWDKDKIELQEEFKVIFLDRAFRAIGIVDFATGGRDGVYIDNALLLGAATAASAHHLVLAHSHPSADTTPSYHDQITTYNLHRACAILGINLMDHLVVSRKGFDVVKLDKKFYKKIYTEQLIALSRQLKDLETSMARKRNKS